MTILNPWDYCTLTLHANVDTAAIDPFCTPDKQRLIWASILHTKKLDELHLVSLTNTFLKFNKLFRTTCALLMHFLGSGFKSGTKIYLIPAL